MERQRVSKTNKASQSQKDQRKPRRSERGKPASIHPILQLQSTIGNQAVQRLLRSGVLQAKLRVGAPGDKYEQEADRVADQVMQMPEPRPQRTTKEEEDEQALQTKPAGLEISPLVQRQEKEELEEELQKKLLTIEPSAVQRQGSPEESEDEEAQQVSPMIQRQMGEEPAEEDSTVAAKPLVRRMSEAEAEGSEEDTIAPKSKSGTGFRQQLQENGDENERAMSALQGQMEEKEEKLAQTKPLANDQFVAGGPSIQSKSIYGQTPQVSPTTGANIQSLNGGNPLPPTAISFFEPRFGADFRQVWVHTDSRAAETAKSIKARAFTIGRNIAFGPGEYSPESHVGRRLLAHELTHVVQQDYNRLERSPSWFKGQVDKGDSSVVHEGANKNSGSLKPKPTLKSNFSPQLKGPNVLQKERANTIRRFKVKDVANVKSLTIGEFAKKNVSGNWTTLKNRFEARSKIIKQKRMQTKTLHEQRVKAKWSSLRKALQERDKLIKKVLDLGWAKKGSDADKALHRLKARWVKLKSLLYNNKFDPLTGTIAFEKAFKSMIENEKIDVKKLQGVKYKITRNVTLQFVIRLNDYIATRDKVQKDIEGIKNKALNRLEKRWGALSKLIENNKFDPVSDKIPSDETFKMMVESEKKDVKILSGRPFKNVRDETKSFIKQLLIYIKARHVLEEEKLEFHRFDVYFLGDKDLNKLISSIPHVKFNAAEIKAIAAKETGDFTNITVVGIKGKRKGIKTSKRYNDPAKIKGIGQHKEGAAKDAIAWAKKKGVKIKSTPEPRLIPKLSILLIAGYLGKVVEDYLYPGLPEKNLQEMN